jgi:hypothetical protein
MTYDKVKINSRIQFFRAGEEWEAREDTVDLKDVDPDVPFHDFPMAQRITSDNQQFPIVYKPLIDSKRPSFVSTNLTSNHAESLLIHAVHCMIIDDLPVYTKIFLRAAAREVFDFF